MNNMSGKDHTSFTNCAEYSVDNVLGDITEFLQNYGHCFYKFCDTETQSQSFTSCSAMSERWKGEKLSKIKNTVFFF